MRTFVCAYVLFMGFPKRKKLSSARDLHIAISVEKSEGKKRYSLVFMIGKRLIVSASKITRR